MSKELAAVWGRSTERAEVRGQEMTVFRRRCRSLPELRRRGRITGRPFLVQGERRLDREVMDGAISTVATCLQSVGAREGDRVAIVAANSIEWILTFWAALDLGAVPVLCNAWWSEEELAHALALVAPAVVVADERRRALLPDGVRTLGVDDLRRAVSGTVGTGPSDAIVASPDGEDDPAVILFTSGTTGHPKGAVLTHRGVIANQQNLLAVTGRLPTDPDPAAATALLAVPLFHLGGLNLMMTTLLSGGTLVLLEGRFDAGEVLALMERERVTAWSAVPTMVQRVLDHPDFATTDLSSVRSVGVGGAPVSAELRARAAVALPHLRSGVTVAYGLTEASGTVSMSRTDAGASPGGCGPPLPTVDVRIDAAAPGEPGEICVRGPIVMLGYWGEEQGPVDAGGWLHTGDLGMLDDDGQLRVVDRGKDVIIRGGENIASANVEAVLMSHPDVLEAAVVGLPDRDLGEVVGAVVVPRPGAEVTATVLAAHCRGRLAHFEVPSAWWLHVDPLPVNTGGKIAKATLRAAWP